MLTLLLVHMQSIYDSTLEGTGPMPAQGTKILNAMECSQIKTKPNQTKSRQSGMGVWEGGSEGWRYMYNYGGFTLLYGRNQNNIVKQLSSN